jgi:hypothetical protein
MNYFDVYALGCAVHDIAQAFVTQGRRSFCTRHIPRINEREFSPMEGDPTHFDMLCNRSASFCILRHSSRCLGTASVDHSAAISAPAAARHWGD